MTLDLIADLRIGLRGFARDRWTTAAIVGTLAVGIGAATAAHAIFNFALFRPVPGVEDEARLVSVYFQPNPATPRRIGVSHGHLVALRESVEGLRGLAAHYTTEFPLRSRPGSAADMRRVTSVTLGFFQMLGVHAVRGRTFAHEEYEQSGRQVAVVSEWFWRTELGGGETVVGHVVSIAGQPFEVIGVVDDFRGLDRMGRDDIWIPFAVRDRIGRLVNTGPDAPEHYQMIGRLTAEATPEQVQAEADAVYVSVGDMPGFTERHAPAVFSGITDGVGQVQGQLLRVYGLLLSGVGLLLLLACANAANLMLARNVRRLPALAMRSAIGASRWRLLRELLVESSLLSVAAGALGVAVAWFLIESFEGSRILAYLPTLEAVPMDRRVLAFVCLASAGTVLAAGLLPALVASRADAAFDLKSTARVSGTGRLAGALVSAQVALAVVLLSGAGVLFRTVAEFQRVDLGLRPDGVTTFLVAPPRLGYDAATTDRLHSEIRERLAAAPGIERVGVSFFPPFTGVSFVRVGLPGEDASAARRIATQHVSSEYFATLGIPLLAGRPFERSGPGIDPPREAVLSASLARQLFGSAPPVGRTVVTWARGRATPRTVVAVAGDTYGRNVREGLQPVMYEPFGHEMRAAFQVRSALPPAESAQLIRGVLAGIDPELPAAELGLVGDQLERNITEERLMARLAATIALIAALLGTSGVYAILSFAVAQRRRELAIRMALGAPRSSIRAGVLRRAAATTAAGLVAGLGLYVWSSRVLESRVFEVTARDPLTVAAACALLMMSALAAAWVPARRATAVDPAIALRSE